MSHYVKHRIWAIIIALALALGAASMELRLKELIPGTVA